VLSTEVSLNIANHPIYLSNYLYWYLYRLLIVKNDSDCDRIVEVSIFKLLLFLENTF